jgi:hypothetical protein
MSTFNRNTLALALAAALLPASAFAFNATTNGDIVPETIAQQVGADLATTQLFEINIQGGDNIIGRTQGFAIKLTLLDGATFGSLGNIAPAPTPGPGLVSGTTPWSIGTIVGGAPGDNFIQIPVSNVNGSGAFVSTGALLSGFTFDLDTVSLTGLTRVKVELIDPGLGVVIQNGATNNFTFDANIIVRSDGLAFSCLAQPNVSVIDVAGNGGAIGAKTQFVPSTAAIGAGPFATTAQLGTITLATTGGFNVAPADTIHSVITGSNLANFSSLFVDTAGNNCAGPALATYPIVGNTAKLGGDAPPLSAAGDGVAASVLGFIASGGSVDLCATVNGTGQIEAQQFTVVNGFNNALESDACNVSPIAFNGSVVKVFQFNPGSSTVNKSFLRVSNWGNTGGKVTIEGWDDAGTAAPGKVTFNMVAGQSVQINSDVLEAGGVSNGTPLTGALGDGTGKWRLVVTGEFDGMAVQSLFRHGATDIVTNLTDADNRGEQLIDKK